MQKLIDNGANGFEESYNIILAEEAKNILDVDKHKELSKDL